MNWGKTMFVCEICKDEFDTEKGLKIHWRHAHHKIRPDNIAVSNSKPKAEVKQSLNFCPCCGYNLHAIRHVMQALEDIGS